MILVNGEPRERDGATIVELLTDLGVEDRARGVAVAVNGEIVPRPLWRERSVRPAISNGVSVIGICSVLMVSLPAWRTAPRRGRPCRRDGTAIGPWGRSPR